MGRKIERKPNMTTHRWTNPAAGFWLMIAGGKIELPSETQAEMIARLTSEYGYPAAIVYLESKGIDLAEDPPPNRSE